MPPGGKRKREDFASQYRAGGFIPQQDGAGDEVFEIEVCLSQPFFPEE
jgi:transcription initiation factor TFIIA large subunit